MISLIGLFGFAVCYFMSRPGSTSTADARHSQPGVAAGLMEQADACAGTSPHRAQELRSAARASLSVVGQR
jgi:hypothetical protein